MKRILFCCLFAFGSSALAWSPLGHEAVGHIALSKLTPTALTEVKKILGNDDFAKSANWADSIKNTASWKHTGTYHYTSVDDGREYFETLASLPKNKQNQGDIVMGILKSLSTLRDSKATAVNKKYALQFLVHFVSNIHQPLHVGRSTDKGGNFISVNWYGKTVNLHWVWDGGIIEAALAEQLKTVPASEQSKWLANYLLEKNSKGDRYEGQLDMEQWISGSFAIRSVVYGGYDASNDSYLNATLPYVESQILKAGLNLAATLNAVFADPSVLSSSEREVIKMLNKSLGRDFRTIVKLEPTFGF